MKKTLSLILAVLMLLPAFACFAIAGESNNVMPLATEEHEGENVASQATITFDGSVGAKVDPAKMVDGDETTGSQTHRSEIYAFNFEFADTLYFTDIVLLVNGSGTLPNGSAVNNSTALDEVTIKLFKAGEEIYSETKSTVGLTEVVFEAELAADTVQIYRDQSNLETKYRGNDFYREVEIYSAEKEFCNVVKSNIAQDAFIYAAGTTPSDYCDNWWAWNPKALIDGDPTVGTHSPKGWNYSVFVEFTRDYLISELNLVVNGKGLLDDGSGIKLEEAQMNVSQICVRLYNLEGEEVYSSGGISVDSTEVKVDPFVEACKIKIEIANGKGDGSEFLWEIETYVEEGNHIFEETATKNPTCNRPGYIQYGCQCSKVIRKSVPATGFHIYDEGAITKEPTETENGVLTKTCYACRETKDFDLPATSHNWDAGVDYEPDCENDGYTKYTCQGCGVAGCDATYVTNVVEKLGHDWDDGVVTKKASVTKYGEKKLTCMRDGCGETMLKQTRKLQYTDSVADFSFADVNYTTNVIYNKTDKYNDKDTITNYNEASRAYPLQDPANLLDDSIDTYWHGTNGTTYEIVFDREYVFTKGTLFASGNSVFLTIQWIDSEDNVTATYTPKWTTINNGCDKNNPISVSLDDSLVGGARAKKILITITGAKWENGAALTLHGLSFVAHSCQFDESDYILSGSNYVAPGCTTDGSCDAKCPVCSNVVKVTLDNDKYGHNVPNVTPDVEATCSDAGYGHGTCTKCSQTIYEVVIPAYGKHVYDKPITYMPAKCGSIGIQQVVCAGCGRVGTQSPIPATNQHTSHWAEDYCASYTASGKEVFICSGCGLPDDDNGLTERELAQKELSTEFLSFVGYSVRTTDYAGIRLTYKIDMELLAEIEYECDVRIITYVTNKDGVTKSVESYGKYSEDRYAETGEFSVVIKPSSYYEEYEVNTVVRLMNFRGVEYVDFDLGTLSTDTNGKISLCEVAEYVLSSNNDLGPEEKAFYEGIVAGK